MAARLINTEETFVLASLKEIVKIWGSGNQASFNFECRNGRAYLKMETHLGTPDQQHFVPPHVPHDGNHQHRKQKSPRQIYRNNARAAAYKAKQNVAETVIANIEVPGTDTSTSASQMTETRKESDAENLEQINQSTPSPNSTPQNVSLPPSNPLPGESQDPPPTAAAVLVAATTSINPVLSATEELTKTDITVVHALAVFEDSPHEMLLQEDMDSLQKFIFSEDHLVRNIFNVESQPLTSLELRSSFKHTIELRINVKCSNLWEPARSYVMKHLGRADYKRSNGTRIHLEKIHVK